MNRWLGWVLIAGASSAIAIAGCGGESHTARDGGGSDGGNSGECDAPLVECGGSCVDPRFDPSHCGGCGMACGAGSLCASGTCTAGCGGALLACGGACVDPRFDPSHCGGCDAACSAGEVCNAGTCSGACGLGTQECEGRCVDTLVDPENCGGCGEACAGGEVCDAGSCAASCSGGTVLCGASCVDIASNVNHCGGCDIACPAGTACIAGSCGMRPTIDADGDTISDFDEAAAASRDTDGDGVPDAMDDDSDGDGITDAMEAGDADVMSPPVDSDGDGLPDFRDLDSDNDGLSDADESAIYGTDPTDPDSDGDGESDAVEVAGGSDPNDPTDTVAGGGDFVFDLPPRGMARTDVLQFNPRIRRADVLFLVDTTGSMGGTITGLRTELNNIVSDVRTAVPDTAFGVARFDDFPVGSYGVTPDVPFGLIQRITTSMAAITSGVAGLTLHGGADLPESQIEAFYQAATGAGFRSAGGTVWTPVFMPSVGFDATLGHGTIGGAGFRMDAQPIIVMATDITFHRKWGDNAIVAGNRATWCGDLATDACDEYAMSSFGTAADQQPKTVAEAVAALSGIGARVLGLAVDGGTGSDQRNELSAFAVATGAFVEPTGGMCATGVSGALRAAEMWDPDGSGPMPARNLCPLVFSSTSAGSGVRAGIVSAITSLTSYVSFSTLHTEARDDPGTTTVDESRFFVRGIPVSYDPATCSPTPTVADRLAGSPPAPGADGTLDSFTGVTPGCLVSFQIVAENDGFVPAACTDQIFSVPVIVVGNDTVEADRRTIVVRVPGDRSLCTP